MKTYPEDTKYLIYPNGKVFSKKTNKLLTPQIDSHGYYQVSISGKTKSLHRLVAETYLPNTLNKREVNHIDGDKGNNNVTNLEWSTSKENKKHAWELGLYNHKGENHYLSSIQEEDVHNICKLLQEGYRSVDICSLLNLDKSLVANIRSGRTWKDISSTYNIEVKRQERKSIDSVVKICNLMEQGLSNSSIYELYPSIPEYDIVRIRSGKIFKNISSNFNIPDSKYKRITKDLATKICVDLSSKRKSIDIQRDYGVSRSVVSKIKNRKAWVGLSINYKW